MKKTILFVFLVSNLTLAQKYQDLALKYAKKHISTYRDFLSIPSDAHSKEDLQKNLTWIESAFKTRGFSTKTLATNSFPALLAERKCSNPNAKTVLIYLQVDGQPVVNAEWQQPSPWVPVLKKLDESGKWQIIPFETLETDFNRDFRIFARAASDAKGPDVMFLAALDAAEEAGIQPNYHMKVIMDFEEEMGSPELSGVVDRFKSDLQADHFVIFDGPPHITNQPTLNFGARGIATIQLTTYGAKTNVHSGNYGNYSPNPALGLVQLLAGMKSTDGKVLLPGFYDGITISKSEQAVFNKVPDNLTEINKKLGIKKPDAVATSFQEAIAYPTLNIRGLKAGEVAEKANTIIPARAIAEIDIRLPMESDGEKLVGIVKNYIEKQGYYITKTDPSDAERATYDKICKFDSEIAYKAFKTPTDSELGHWLSKALKTALGKEPIKIQTVGGSIPISPFVVKLGINAVCVPTVNPDNSQHAPNENLRIGNFIDGIQTMIAILAEKL